MLQALICENPFCATIYILGGKERPCLVAMLVFARSRWPAKSGWLQAWCSDFGSRPTAQLTQPLEGSVSPSVNQSVSQSGSQSGRQSVSAPLDGSLVLFPSDPHRHARPPQAGSPWSSPRSRRVAAQGWWQTPGRSSTRLWFVVASW